jgi:hypothetical protein
MTRRLMTGVAALTALVTSTADAQQIRVAGYTGACFFRYDLAQTSCNLFQSLVNSSSVGLGNLGFSLNADVNGNSFDDFTSGGQLSVGGLPNDFGTLTLAAGNVNYGGNVITGGGNLGIGLLVHFVDPTGIVSGGAPVVTVQPIFGRISGRTTGAGGGVAVDFDNTPQGPFAFTSSTPFGDPVGSGAGGSLIAFRVKDLSINSGQTQTISGDIVVELAPVPEPATVALTATGLVAVLGAGLRRRRAAGA